MVTQDFYISSNLPEDNSLKSCVLVLLMTIVFVVRLSPRGASTPPFISKGGEVIRKVTKSVIT
jgi:hypothetical protein